MSVDGLTMAVSAHIPKNILIPKSWKAVVYVDERATAEQEGVLLKLFTGQLGGAIADLAGLIGEVVAVERAPITFTVDGGKGKLTIGTRVEAEMAPFMGATGNPTTLAETVFSTIPGSPVYASKASQYTRDGSGHGHPERRPPGPQRPPGPLPLRRLTRRPIGRHGPMFAPAHLRVAHRDRAILAGSLVAIAGTAWLALWLWEGSPYGHYLHHDGRRLSAVGTSARPSARRPSRSAGP